MKINKFKKDLQNGLSVIEIIVGSAILLTVITSITTLLIFYVSLEYKTSLKTSAAILLEEGSEAVQIMRDSNWTENIASLSNNVDYFLYWNGIEYKATTTPSLINEKFYRTITLSNIERAGDDSIVQNGFGTIDDKTKKVTIKITNQQDNEILLESDMLIHDVFNN